MSMSSWFSRRGLVVALASLVLVAGSAAAAEALRIQSDEDHHDRVARVDPHSAAGGQAFGGPLHPAAPNGLEIYTLRLSGPAESPPNTSTATGSGSVIINPDAATMDVAVTFAGLVGTTTAAHIHSATAVAYAGTAGVATTVPTFATFPLGVTSGTFHAILDMTSASSYNPTFVTNNGGTTTSAFAALRTGLAAGKVYFNIHTNVYPGGEIRGFASPLNMFLPLIQR